MEDAKTWLEKFNQESKEDNVQLKTELINSHRPVDYVISEFNNLLQFVSPGAYFLKKMKR
jgi:hypothetical protein